MFRIQIRKYTVGQKVLLFLINIEGNTCIQPTTTRLAIKYVETNKKIRNKEEKLFLIRL